MLSYIMRNRTTLKTTLLGVLFSGIAVVLLLAAILLLLRDREQQVYEQEVKFFGRLLSLGVITREAIPEILTKDVDGEFQIGLEALRRIGYDQTPPGFFPVEFTGTIVAIVGMAVFLILIWLSTIAFLSKKQSQFLKSMATELDAIASGRHSSFSGLEEEGDEAVLRSQLETFSRRLETMKRDVFNERDKMKAFISFISHELKTPLASIKMMNELMLNSTDMKPEQFTEFLSRTRKDVERMEWLINDVLSIARIESGAIRFSFRKVNLADITRKVVERYTEIARARLIDIEITPQSELSVFCDEKWLSQAIDNIVRNAVYYSPEEGSISIRILSGSSYVRLLIHDDGPGVPKSEASRIFESFYRGVQAGETRKGSGLGLALARAIVVRHGGDIKLERNPGKGSTFTVELPAGIEK